MPAKKKAVTKAPAKKRTRKLKELVMYVLSKRTRLFFWEPIQVFPTYKLAAEYKELYEAVSPYGPDGYKITKVDVVNAPVDSLPAGEVVAVP